MAVGDIDISNFNIGSLDLTDPSAVQFVGFNVYQDIMNPTGPVGEVMLNDHTDALGRYNITGKEEVNLSFLTDIGNHNLEIKGKLLQGTNYDDRSKNEGVSMHSKRATLRWASPEHFNAKKTPNYQKSHETQISNIMQTLYKDTFQTKKPFNITVPTDGIVREITTGDPLEIHKNLLSKSYSSKYKSSTFVAVHRPDEIEFTTFEHMFEQSSVKSLNQTVHNASLSEQEKNNGIIWFHPTSGFISNIRPDVDTKQNTYDPTTGKMKNVNKSAENKFIVSGKQLFNSGEVENADWGPKVNRMIYRPNRPQPTNRIEAEQNRRSFLANLKQNYADLEVHGDNSIKLGNMIDLNIPNKSQNSSGEMERQFNGKAMVVAIRHKIRPMGQSPRYTMVLRVIKGGYDQGGQG